MRCHVIVNPLLLRYAVAMKSLGKKRQANGKSSKRRKPTLFLSYSGKRSEAIAKILQSLIRKHVPGLKPRLFPGATGGFWAGELIQALDEIKFAVLCITPENRRSRWLHFEAGALMKPLGRGLVIPFLYELRHEELEEPLRWFNGRTADKSGVIALLQDIGEHFKKTPQGLKKVPQKWTDSVKSEVEGAAGPLPVGRDNKHNNRILTNFQTVQYRSNDFRRYLASHIISDTFAASNELAHLAIVDDCPPETYVKATVGYKDDMGALADARSIRALCGGKVWHSDTIEHYYTRNYDWAERVARPKTASRAGGPVWRRGMAPLVQRIFVEPKGGFTDEAKWRVMLDHYNKRNFGVQARVLPDGNRVALAGIDPIIESLIQQGFGFFAVEYRHCHRVFTHLGGGQDGRAFKFAEYTQPLSVRAILGLFDVLNSNSVDFTPRKFPRPPRARAKRTSRGGRNKQPPRRRRGVSES